jgi:hypothetical protein
MSNDLCSYGPIVCTCSRSASSDTMMSNNNKAIRTMLLGIKKNSTWLASLPEQDEMMMVI